MLCPCVVESLFWLAGAARWERCAPRRLGATYSHTRSSLPSCEIGPIVWLSRFRGMRVSVQVGGVLAMRVVQDLLCRPPWRKVHACSFAYVVERALRCVASIAGQELCLDCQSRCAVWVLGDAIHVACLHTWHVSRQEHQSPGKVRVTRHGMNACESGLQAPSIQTFASWRQRQRVGVQRSSTGGRQT
jgi:hypothetical protein